MNRWVPCPEWSLVYFLLVKGFTCLDIVVSRDFFVWERALLLKCNEKKWGWKWDVKINEWCYRCWARDGAPLPREPGRCCCFHSGIIWGFSCTSRGAFTSLLSFLQTIPWVCQSPSLTLPCLELDSMIWGKINRWKLLLHSLDGLFSPPGPPPGLLAQASVGLLSVKLILEQGHHKVNNKIITILHHLAGLFSPYQRTATRGHLRPPGDVLSSLLASLTPYISDLITCETQSKGLRCYAITKSRFIWTWEA